MLAKFGGSLFEETIRSTPAPLSQLNEPFTGYDPIPVTRDTSA